MGEHRDTDVVTASQSLAGRRIVLGISGGIAMVDSVRLLREFRRHGAEVVVIMTHSAQQILSPLAVEWASLGPMILDWESDMSQLEEIDGIIVCPATRHTIASHIHGLLDSPLQMALTAARGRAAPMMFIPSMHGSLSADHVTDDLVKELEKQGSSVLWGSDEEGRMKTPDTAQIVAEFSHLVNSRLPNRRDVAITLGATKSMIDDIRFIANTSSGRTGFAIAEFLYRMGHNVTIIRGLTSVDPLFPLPILVGETAPEMLDRCIELAKSDSPPDVWVHSAAVLDYVVEDKLQGKVKSGSETWSISLSPSEKHIEKLSPLVGGALRIGFKLESAVGDEQLTERAMESILKYDLDYCFANHLESRGAHHQRGVWIDSDGHQTDVSDLSHLTRVIADVVATTTND